MNEHITARCKRGQHNECRFACVCRCHDVRPRLLTLDGQPLSWATLHARAWVWWRRRGRRRRGVAHRPDQARKRGIVLTEAGKAWLDEHRTAGVVSAASSREA